MTRYEAVELATHFYGRLVFCDQCQCEPYDGHTASPVSREYDDAELGQWLLTHGWHFEWEEHDHEGGPRSGKFPFMYYPPERADSLSWSFRLLCPQCQGRLAVP